MNSPLYDESSDGTYHKYDTVEKVYSLKSSYARNSFSEETIQNLKKYKHSLLLKIIMVVLLILTLIAERIISYRLEKVEIDLLLNIQKSEYLGIDPFNQRNDFYFLIGMFGEFHIFFLIQTHLFISVYVAVDAFVALKTAFLQLLGCYIYSIISIYYSNPRPFWVNSQIRSYFCEKSFSEPGLFQFSSIFLIIYFYKSFKELEEDVVLVEAERNSLDSDNESFINVNSSRNKNRILKSLLIFFLMLLILIFIFRYLQGLVYLHNYFIGMVYFVSLMGIVLFFDNYLQNMIKQTTIIKRYAKGKVFFWLILLVIAEFLAVVIRNSYEKTQINLTWIENMVLCEQRNYGYKSTIYYDDILGPYVNLQETTMLFGLVGMLFGANKAFQTIHNVNWFRGNLKLKLIRVLIVNIMIIPSWILVIFTSELFNKQPLEGLAVFLMNSLHFYVLYYFLFGIIPAYIFKRFRLISSEFKVSHLIPQKRI